MVRRKGYSKKKYWQTGKTTRSIDKRRVAKKPGKRVSSTGRTYFERRRNRSDISRKMRL